MSVNPIAQPLTYWFRTAAYDTPDQGDDAEWKLQVVRFEGLEAISHPYRYVVDLVSREPEVQFSEIIHRPGQLAIERRELLAGSEVTTSYVNGIVTEFEMTGRTSYWYHYRAVIRPRMWLLSLTRRSRIFSNRSVPEIIRMVLEEADTTIFHEIALEASYPVRETVVQHHETDLAFLHRIAAREGIRFVFEQDDQHDTVHVLDAAGKDPRIVEDADGKTTLPFEDAEGAMAAARPEVVAQAFAAERTVTKSVEVQEYNYRTPSAGLAATDDAAGGGSWEGGDEGEGGLYQEFGTHHKDAGDGKRMARIRRERLHTFRRTLVGQSTCTRFRAGQRFGLSGHYRASLDGDFLLVALRQRGRQADAFFGQGQARLRSDDDERPTGPEYLNVYGAVPVAVPYRPSQGDDLRAVFPAVFAGLDDRAIADVLGTGIDRTVEVGGADAGTGSGGGRMLGLMTARLTGPGDYGAIDDQGRYVMDPAFPHQGGSTHAARMVQPYAGKGNAGFHFPSHAGNEVIYACLDGDPDRPVILGPVPEPDYAAPVTSANSSQHIFRTTSRNEFLVEDRKGSEKVRLFTPKNTTSLVMGIEGGNEGAALRTDGTVTLQGKAGGLFQFAGGLSVSTWGFSDKTTSVMGSLTPAATALMAAAATKFARDNVFKVKSVLEFFNTMNTVAGWALAAASALGEVGEEFGMGKGSTQSLKSIPSPGIFMTSKGGFDLVCKEGTNIVSAGGISLFTILSAGITAVDQIGLTSGTGIGLFARQGNIALTANRDDVAVRAEKDVDVEAKKNYKLNALDENITIEAQKGSMSAKAKQKVELEAAEDVFKIDAKKKSVIVKAKQMVGLDGGDQVVIESGQSSITLDKAGKIKLKVGSNTIEISQSGIKVKGIQTSMEASATCTVKGAMTKVEGSGMCDVKGAMTNVKGDGMATLKGALTMVG